MIHRRIHPTLTPPRRAWLEHLELEGAAICSTKVGFYCRRLKWTAFTMTRGEEELHCSEVERLYAGTDVPAHRAATLAGWVMTGREMLTDLGREVLQQARAAERQP